jgi:nucleoside-diphosphate-sugar epimerase
MILVVGATGVVGGMVTLGLLEQSKVEQGKEVRALVRRDSPSSQLVQQGLATSAETLSESGAHLVHGDLRDRGDGGDLPHLRCSADEAGDVRSGAGRLPNRLIDAAAMLLVRRDSSPGTVQ